MYDRPAVLYCKTYQPCHLLSTPSCSCLPLMRLLIHFYLDATPKPDVIQLLA